jgi:hypothetical protein
MKPLYALILLAGCQKDHIDQEPFLITDAGYAVRWQDDGTLDQGLYTKAELYAAFDAAVERSAGYLAKYGAQPSQVLAAAHGSAFTLIDNRRFWMPSTWVSGCNSMTGSIMVVYWGTKTGATLPVDLACPWTAAFNPANGLWYWGIDPKPYPALGHELGHSLYGATFEHPELGWRWPQ